jgi:1-phosphofructokinase family hexose kinase
MITVIVLSPAVDKIYFIDNFEAGNLYRVKNISKSAGGKGINVSRVANTLGEKVTAIGFKAGETGKWLEAQLREAGVKTEFVEIVGESRTNSNIIDGITGAETELLETGPYVKAKDLDNFLDTYSKVLEKTKVLVCTGGIPEGVSKDFYRKLIDIANEKHIKVILDASNEILEQAIKAKPYMVKPNLRELSNYVNRKLSNLEEIIEACRSIISKGVIYVAASMGEAGAVLVSKNTVYFANIPKIKVINAIGSGDSMVAGLAAGLIRNYSDEEMFRLSVACSISNTQFREIGFIDIEQMKGILSEIKIDNK